MRVFRGVVIACFLVSIVPAVSQGATALKAGTACKTVGKVRTTSAGKFVCTQVGKKRIWRAQKLIPSVPTPTPLAAISPAGQPCDGYSDNAAFEGKIYVCREVAREKFEFFELESGWPAAVNGVSPNDFQDCRLPDMRAQKTAAEMAVTYPSRPRMGSSKTGVHRVAVVGIDFNDVRGKGSPLDLFDTDDLKTSASFFDWYSGGKASIEFTKYAEWIHLNYETSSFATGEHFDPKGGLTLREMANAIYDSVNSKTPLVGFSAVWFVYPPEAEKVSNNFGAAAGWTKLAIYGLGKRAFDEKIPFWTYFIHEMLHEQGLAGHSPKQPWVFGVMFNGNGMTSGMNSWDQLTNDWASNIMIYCVDKSRLTEADVQIAPIERRQAGTHSIMVKLDDHRALVIESHRRGEFSPGMPNQLYGLTIQLVDTTQDTTWDTEQATSTYIRVGNHTRFPNPGVTSTFNSGVSVWNGKGFMGLAWGWTTDWLLLQGESIIVEGIKVEFLSSGPVDHLRISRSN